MKFGLLILSLIMHLVRCNYVKCFFFPLASFRIPPLSFIFCSLKIMTRKSWVLGFLVFAFIPGVVLWDSWICGLLSDINLGEFVSHHFIKLFFLFLLSLLLLVFPLCNYKYLCSCPIVLRYSIFFPQFLFSLPFDFQEFLICPLAQIFFSQLCPVY